MSKHFKSVKLELLGGNEENQFNHTDDEYVSYPFPKEVGTGKGNMLKTSHSISIYKGLHYYNTDLTSKFYDLGMISCEFTEEVLMVDLASGGTIKMQNRNSEEVFSYGRQKTLFRRLTGFEANFRHERSECMETITISIPLTSIRLIIGEKSTNILLSALNLTLSSSVIIHSLPLRISNILLDAISPHLQGSMKKLYGQAKIVEYLCELVEYIEKNSGTLTVDDKQILKAQEIHSYLSQVTGKLPSLVDLALNANMSTQALNSAFKKEFGMTIHRFMTRKRLHEAHDAILETDISLKVLADNIGYSHVNHFITAFKKEFTYTPGYLRKRDK